MHENNVIECFDHDRYPCITNDGSSTWFQSKYNVELILILYTIIIYDICLMMRQFISTCRFA